MGGSLWWVPPSPVDSRGPGGADALLTLKCHQCFLFFCHLLCTPGRSWEKSELGLVPRGRQHGWESRWREGGWMYGSWDPRILKA